MPTPDSDVSERTKGFDLVVPPDPELLRVVRLVASGLASFTALDLDAVEGVRVAADELVATLMQASVGDEVAISFAVTADALTIEASTRTDGGAFTLDPLTDRILDEVATGHDWRTEGDHLHGRVVHALPTISA